MYLLTDNLLIPILLHIFHNSLVVGLMFISPGWPEWLTVMESADIYTKAVPNAIVLFVTSILIFAVILRLAQSLNKKKRRREVPGLLKKNNGKPCRMNPIIPKCLNGVLGYILVP
nr:hypothetical protein [Planococcus glaciei]